MLFYDVTPNVVAWECICCCLKVVLLLSNNIMQFINILLQHLSQLVFLNGSSYQCKIIVRLLLVCSTKLSQHTFASKWIIFKTMVPDLLLLESLNVVAWMLFCCCLTIKQQQNNFQATTMLFKCCCLIVVLLLFCCYLTTLFWLLLGEYIYCLIN